MFSFVQFKEGAGNFVFQLAYTHHMWQKHCLLQLQIYWWNWMYYILNAVLQIIFSARIIIAHFTCQQTSQVQTAWVQIWHTRSYSSHHIILSPKTYSKWAGQLEM